MEFRPVSRGDSRIGQAVTDGLNAYYFTVAAEYALEDIRVKVFEKLHTLGMRFFDQVPAGSLVTRVNNDTASLADFWRFFMQLTFVAMSMIGAYIGMLTVCESHLAERLLLGMHLLSKPVAKSINDFHQVCSGICVNAYRI